ncbi:hypothetical protein PNOK_0042200 [Pyrrhoderma noxium]|uniref:Uncharacterized protein n=1 Tax=Pyrrhoderma noxium TaxID=2282107 RepID=A0A286UUW6_9AGAM|nr:hypothetical protein PNOK_0042200 [Pyrrhoderma noxium]
MIRKRKEDVRWTNGGTTLAIYYTLDSTRAPAPIASPPHPRLLHNVLNPIRVTFNFFSLPFFSPFPSLTPIIYFIFLSCLQTYSCSETGCSSIHLARSSGDANI